ncbi:DUF4274 domain-containing protein [Gimesia aquarii]|uniref:DUF4274 domain-containing protein n=1 Tax=Gimesia aquarii TaxID=2527964 RepID=A0A517VWM6_9PLAN|nr:DUF4274 domain-containing protein [Gimesia aquarii]QDT97407.1 hypothetical protein V144x_28820 [Gimesia aquarii]
MAKKVRKKTKAELADPAFRKRATTQSKVLTLSYSECDKLAKSRHQYILDVAASEWINRFESIDDDAAFEKECRKWDKLRREFVKSVSKPLDIHCFTCNYDASNGMKPLIQLGKHPSCDAGTALRLFWVYEPVFYYSQYATISECAYEEDQDAMRLLKAIERRFKKSNFKTHKIYFDPKPWLEACEVDLESLRLPDSMLVSVP